jgi:hypothetical protein
MRELRPLYSRKRTLIDNSGMSAKGQKRTLINRLDLRQIRKLPREPHGRMLTQHGW